MKNTAHPIGIVNKIYFQVRWRITVRLKYKPIHQLVISELEQLLTSVESHDLCLL